MRIDSTVAAVGTFATITRFAAGAATLDPVDGERGAIVCTASVAAQDGQDMRDRLSATTAYPNRFGEPHEDASLALELRRNTSMNAQAIRLDAGFRFASK